MGRIKRGWYERETVKKITLDWIKTNVKPTKREMELLQLIHDRKLVRRDMLEIISPSYRHLNSRTRLINRAIKKLFNNMCIDKVHEKQEIGMGNFPCTIALDKGGSLLLGVPHKKRIIQKRKNIKGREYIFRSLPTNYRHINMVNQLEVETILFCEETSSKIVNWKHEYGRSFTYGDKEILVIPDVFLILELNDKKFYSYIEADTGSENRGYKNEFPIIKEKLKKYRKYKLSELWEDEAEYFPVILFITEDKKRISYFNKKCREYGLEGFGVYHESYTNFLQHLLKIV